MSLYDQLGGDGAITAAVDAFYQRMLADPALSAWFVGIDLGSLKEHQRAFLAVGLGGPELYEGREMRTAHRGLGITHEVYSRSIEHLSDALRELGVQPDVLVQVTKRIEAMRAMIVESR